ncbi:response regulator [Acuticoccus sp. M5D2P5]|uniref:response regulator transcription factor n=1 Tax=Acuticoccus kalidii TaxID=2910977 RepID=UPI001F3F2396|nr:response regulator [Acuticoccus kalidii]MCF3932838.1 response regulator [Acuticoccus kalidii]
MTRVLIVEDEPHIAEALVYLLEREGITAKVIANGEEAMTAVGDYDLIVLDIMLPGRSGFDVAEAVRGLAVRPKTCVLTAKGQAADRARMEALGVDAFVTKPFSNRALMETVRTLLAEA